MTHARTSALGAAIAILAMGCQEQHSSLPTVPRTSAAIAPATIVACQKTDASYLSQQITTVFGKSLSKQASTDLKADVQACPSRAAMFTYVKDIVAWKKQGLIPNTAADGTNPALWDYLVRLFNFNGFALTQGAGALGNQGFIGTCDPSVECPVVAHDSTSGIEFHPGALPNVGTFLVTGALVSCAPLQGTTNLQVFGQCLEITADPKDGPHLSLGSAGADVIICQVDNVSPTPAFVPGRQKLAEGRDTGNGITVRPPLSTFFFTPHCHDASLARANGARDAGLLARAGRALERVGDAIGSALSPTPLYAIHCGLCGTGGKTSGLSVFGPLDPYNFQATFNTDVPGSPPGAPDRGSWFIDTTSTAQLTVVASVGDIASNALLLNQHTGGANPASDTIVLRALPLNGAATEGTYLVRWRSLVHSPSVKYAPLVIRDGTGAEIARFEYRQGPSAKTGPQTLTVQGQTFAAGTWSQDVSQLYTVTIDLAAHTVALSINGTAVVSPTSSAFSGFGSAGWELSGIDAEILGIDNFEILRIPDSGL